MNDRDQKAKVIEALGLAVESHPDMRVAQVMAQAVENVLNTDVYYCSDQALEGALLAFAADGLLL